MEQSLRGGGSSRARVNKQFVLNTVDGLKSHNRREEEEECWRHHRLELETQHHLYQNADRRRSESKCEKAIKPSNAADERQFWAQAKARAMSAAQSDDAPTSGPNVASMESDTSFTPQGQAVAREVEEEEMNSLKRGRSEEVEINVENKNRQKKKKRRREKRDKAKGTRVEDEVIPVLPNANSAGRRDGRRESDRDRRKRKKSSKKRSKDKHKKECRGHSSTRERGGRNRRF